MIILGLTGSIGMGKSTTADMFRSVGIAVHDADKVVHELYQNEAVPLLRQIFPSAIVDGAVDRQALGRIVLGDDKKMHQLENLIHPLVRKKELAFLENAKNNNAPLAVLDIPLLFETGSDKRVDVILVVTASAQEQKKRVLSRPDMDEAKFKSILKHQMPDSEKKQRADFIIDTQLGFDKAHQSVRQIIRQLSTTGLPPGATG